MKKLLCALVSAAFLAVPMATVSTPVMAKTANQMKNEKKGADAKAKSKAKSDARKAKSSKKK